MFFVYKKFRLFFNGFWRFGRWAQNAKCRAVLPKAGGLGKLYHNNRPKQAQPSDRPKDPSFLAFQNL